MCWWVKVSVPLVYNLGVRVGDVIADVFYNTFHCLSEVIAGKNRTSFNVFMYFISSRHVLTNNFHTSMKTKSVPLFKEF